MSSKITGTGVQFPNIIYNQYGGQTTATQEQKKGNAIVKVRIGSATTVDQAVNGSSGANGYIDGTEMPMGVPAAPNNWYRLMYSTIADDTSGGSGGWGIRVYRHTPSAGWEYVLSQGEHASYENDIGDWYRCTHGIFWVPVNQTYPTEAHSFRFYWTRHSSANIRINSSIGNDLRRSNWQNNQYECWEINGDRIHSTGSLTVY